MNEEPIEEDLLLDLGVALNRVLFFEEEGFAVGEEVFKHEADVILDLSYETDEKIACRIDEMGDVFASVERRLSDREFAKKLEWENPDHNTEWVLEKIAEMRDKYPALKGIGTSEQLDVKLGRDGLPLTIMDRVKASRGERARPWEIDDLPTSRQPNTERVKQLVAEIVSGVGEAGSYDVADAKRGLTRFLEYLQDPDPGKTNVPFAGAKAAFATLEKEGVLDDNMKAKVEKAEGLFDQAKLEIRRQSRSR